MKYNNQYDNEYDKDYARLLRANDKYQKHIYKAVEN